MEISESEAQRTGKYHRLTGARPAGFLHSGFRYAPPLIHSLRRALCSFFAQLFFSKLCLTSLTNVQKCKFFFLIQYDSMNKSKSSHLHFTHTYILLLRKTTVFGFSHLLLLELLRFGEGAERATSNRNSHFPPRNQIN